MFNTCKDDKDGYIFFNAEMALFYSHAIFKKKLAVVQTLALWLVLSSNPFWYLHGYCNTTRLL